MAIGDPCVVMVVQVGFSVIVMAFLKISVTFGRFHCG